MPTIGRCGLRVQWTCSCNTSTVASVLVGPFADSDYVINSLFFQHGMPGLLAVITTQTLANRKHKSHQKHGMLDSDYVTNLVPSGNTFSLSLRPRNQLPH